MQRLFPVPLKTVLMMFVGTVTLFLVNCGDDSPGGGTPGGGLPGGGGDAGVYAALGRAGCPQMDPSESIRVAVDAARAVSAI